MCKRNGFTLIELLVVISIIALLMAILMPALSRVKDQAKAAACMSNLKQWAVIFQMYAGDNDGMFWNRVKPGGFQHWPSKLYSYYKGQEELRLCPTAAKYTDTAVGSSLTAWGPMGNYSWCPDLLGYSGSYGINSWIYNELPNQGWDTPEHFQQYWRRTDVKGAAKIPILLDSYFVDGWPRAVDNPPEYRDEISTSTESDGMKRYCLDRHSGTVNVALMDYSVGRIKLKQLWTLRWHRDYNVNGPWTRAGGCTSEMWPEWMRGFEEF